MTDDDTPEPAARRLRSAMFVDFDNVFSGLRRLDEDAAKAFAEDPARWVDSLVRGADDEGPFVRRFLVQKCYLNPAPYSRYRPNFTRAGFHVVDCPSLTQQGKSSADINLVLDAMDALGASTRFDEFVFLSGDADFTPLVMRCRAADRAVMIITPGPTAAAYRSVADKVVSADLFIGLVTRVPSDARPAEPVVEGVRVGGEAPSRMSLPPGAGAVAVRQLVATSDRIVHLATAAAVALQAEPVLRDSDWDGAGSFTTWLRRELPGVSCDTRTPGYVWDPDRFSEADLPASQVADGGEGAPKADDLQRQVATVTEIPALDRATYRVLLEQISFDLALYPFNRTETSKRVRDSCAERGAPVGRAAVNFVMNGLLLAGADLEAEPSASELAAVWAENVLGLCRGARIELDAAQTAEISAWATGGLVPVPAP